MEHNAEIEKRSKIEADRLQRQAEYAAELERKKAKQIPLNVEIDSCDGSDGDISEALYRNCKKYFAK